MSRRWSQRGYFVVISGSVEILPGEQGSVERFVAYHNATCDTYETELATLRADILAAVAHEEGGNNHEFHPCTIICRKIRAIVEGNQRA